MFKVAKGLQRNKGVRKLGRRAVLKVSYLPRIEEKESFLEQSNLEESTFHLLAALETVTFRIGEEQQTFWFSLPKQEKVKSMMEFEKTYAKNYSPAKEIERQEEEFRKQFQQVDGEMNEPSSCEQEDIEIEQQLDQMEQQELASPKVVENTDLPHWIQLKQSAMSCYDGQLSTYQALPFPSSNDELSQIPHQFIHNLPASVQSQRDGSDIQSIVMPDCPSEDEYSELIWLASTNAHLYSSMPLPQLYLSVNSFLVRMCDFLSGQGCPLSLNQRESFWGMMSVLNVQLDCMAYLANMIHFLNKYDQSDSNSQRYCCMEQVLVRERIENISLISRSRRQGEIAQND